MSNQIVLGVNKRCEDCDTDTVTVINDGTDWVEFTCSNCKITSYELAYKGGLEE